MSDYHGEFMGRAQLEALGVLCSGDDVRVHASVVLLAGERLRLGNHVRVDPFTLLSATGGISLGNHVHIGSHCSLIGGGGIEIRDFAGISHGARIFSASDDFSGLSLTGPTVSDADRKVAYAPILVGRHAVIGSGAIILPGGTLEEGAVVGAFSLVKKKIPAWEIWGGVPARHLSRRKKDLLAFEQSEGDEAK
jgi:acetyltransferase-like isoleucine patch superfamily enzyme